MTNCNCCKDCTNRHYKCHCTCEEYKAFRAKRDAENAKIHSEKNKDQFFIEHKKKIWEKRKKGGLR